ncbi:unnamed protein product [Vitrella brassicaformis CCMP3155]|uniref:Uncharacterized protein n=1 Tax=Vitrella brassicaformis (strain CCMP3155) TaxID=1169540 RepID=A0A0G4GUE5_VITBC|nr:unnamed protein product [Vitrella brassicaformis CCMP3155]|eukprot:CEM34432.1 unnamed protein product [Vitrella brassicaformis CCMP3155]
MEVTGAVIELYQMCRAAASKPAESEHDSGLIHVEDLKKILLQQFQDQTPDKKAALEAFLVRRKFGLSEEMDFLRYWKDMETLLESIGIPLEEDDTQHSGGDRAEEDNLTAMRRFRDGILKLKVSAHGQLPLCTIRAVLMDVRDAAKDPFYWDEVMNELPDDDSYLSVKEVGDALFQWMLEYWEKHADSTAEGSRRATHESDRLPGEEPQPSQLLNRPSGARASEVSSIASSSRAASRRHRRRSSSAVSLTSKPDIGSSRAGVYESQATPTGSLDALKEELERLQRHLAKTDRKDGRVWKLLSSILAHLATVEPHLSSYHEDLRNARQKLGRMAEITADLQRRLRENESRRRDDDERLEELQKTRDELRASTHRATVMSESLECFKAEREELHRECERLRRHIAQSFSACLQADLQHQQAETIQELQTELTSLREAMCKAEEDRNVLQESLRSYAAFAIENDEVATNLDRASQEPKCSIEHASAMQQRIAVLEQHLQAMAKNLSEKEDQLRRATDGESERLKEVELLTQKVRQAEQLLEQTRATRDQLIQAVQTMGINLHASKQRNVDGNRGVKGLQTYVKVLHKNISQLETDIHQLRAHWQSAEAPDITMPEPISSSLQDQILRAIGDPADRSQMEELQRAVQEKDDHIQTLRQQITSNEETLALLQRQQEDREGRLEKLKIMIQQRDEEIQQLKARTEAESEEKVLVRRLRDEVRVLQSEKEALEQENDRKGCVSESVFKIEERKLIKRIQQLEKDLTTKEAMLKRLRQQLEEKSSKVRRLQQEIDEARRSEQPEGTVETWQKNSSRLPPLRGWSEDSDFDSFNRRKRVPFLSDDPPKAGGDGTPHGKSRRRAQGHRSRGNTLIRERRKRLHNRLADSDGNRAHRHRSDAKEDKALLSIFWWPCASFGKPTTPVTTGRPPERRSSSGGRVRLHSASLSKRFNAQLQRRPQVTVNDH